jgi:G3E family GTPase
VRSTGKNREREVGEAVPVTILTGFLGAGKTTLLRRILSDPQGVRFGVLVNDFGAVNIDADLVVEASAGRIALENGCVCCSIQGDLVGALAELLDRDPRPDRIVIEASGVSRPLPVAAALEAEELAGRVTLDGIFCMVDAETFGGLDFEATELALDQVAGSDLAILTKTDIAPPDRIATVEMSLAGALPRIRMIRAAHGDVPRALLLGPEAVRSADRHGSSHDRGHHDGDHDGHHHGHYHSDHGAEFAAWHWRSPAALSPRDLRIALRNLPDGILRAKGVIRPADGEGRIVVQLVGKRLEVTREPVPAPAESALVAIGRRASFDPAALDALMADCAAGGLARTTEQACR